MSKQRTIFAVSAFAAIALVIAVLYVTRRSWLWLPFNPRYTASEIVGLHRSEVLSHLGQPDYDARAHDHEAVDCWGYYGAMGAGIAVDFDEVGKAVSVRDASK